MDNTPTLRLLLADRDAGFTRIFQERFRALAGHTVTIDTCTAGADLVERFYAQPYDLVFLDLALPGLDPKDLLSRLSQTSLPLPVVALSSEHNTRPVVEAMKLGVLDHLMKEDFATLDLAGFVGRLRETFRLRRENAELLQINQMKNDFLATISHELRTPLTSILGLSEILLAGRMGPLVPRQSESLKKIIEQSQNLAKLINQLLDVQDIVQERMRLDFRPLSLAEITQARGEAVEPLFKQKGVSLRVEPMDDRLIFQGDREAVDKVLEHVLLNALKFTPAKGLVLVSAKALPPRSIQLSVLDTGQGIPNEALPYVFQKFFHADQSLTRAYGGLGLGLAYCKHVVEALGGRIWVESAGVGKGTRVNMTFPQAGLKGVDNGKSLKTVLWVDDNPNMLELIEVGFTALPTNVKLLTCRSGTAALESANTRPPDLIVLDIMMPDMNGLEVLDRLQKNEKTRKVPVMVVSGYREAAQEAVGRGAVDYFLKPFRVPEMLEKIRHHLGLPKEP
ncbi:MAG TPA: response regulator [Elusimicrobiota bacterium]|nr:response regulator [Elusimicrobiota bacterium]HMX94733.1 response regulator [Elusimicrobiota bacterium]HNA60584.1 response regulator [Elusimicrobiota bacterium]